MGVSIPIGSLYWVPFSFSNKNRLPFGAFFDDELSDLPKRKLTLVLLFPIFVMGGYDDPDNVKYGIYAETERL